MDKEIKVEYYRYFYSEKDETKERGWIWVECDYKTYKEHWKIDRSSVSKSRN